MTGHDLRHPASLIAALLATVVSITSDAQEEYSPSLKSEYPQNVYWGDTHLHTNLSADAVFKLGPDEAYRFALGEVVTSSSGVNAQITRPLDFLVVADHGNNMGAELTRERIKTDAAFRSTTIAKLWEEAKEDLLDTDGTDTERLLNGPLWQGDKKDVAIRHPGFRQNIWDTVTSNADRYNDPGQFTAFIGYEYTPGLGAIHRVVIFKDDAVKAQEILPFTSWDSFDPEDLWSFMADYEENTGGSILAIPHNGNLTSGPLMFPLITSKNEPLTRDYNLRRSRWEPLVEATQIKGDSETHPTISPDDEFADFETWNGWAGRVNGGVIWTGRNTYMRPDNEIQFQYSRSALKLGLGEQARTGVNPFKFGMIGSSDSHTGLAAVDENNFFGKTMSAEPSSTRVLGKWAINNWEMNAAGYAAVWSKENTRESIFDAMQRKEVYASTGPRMTVRFFGGWDYTSGDAARSDLAEIGYAKGVPMGGDLAHGPKGKSPKFLIRAVKDPIGAHLDRLQVVKGWRDENGELHEQVYNVAVSDDRKINSRGKVSSVGSTVDVENASYRNSIGDPELAVVWKDPDFKSDEAAFYYVRVLEIPTPRWTAYDAKLYGLDELPQHITMTTQERAYTSPIWYTP